LKLEWSNPGLLFYTCSIEEIDPDPDQSHWQVLVSRGEAARHRQQEVRLGRAYHEIGCSDKSVIGAGQLDSPPAAGL
jgi:hypothetical protein